MRSGWGGWDHRWDRWAAGIWARRGLAGLLRSAGGRVEAERLDVVCADAQAWWAEQWAHGERRPLERMGRRALAAYRAAAFAAIEACREADGGLHWRAEVIYAVATS
jgi:hypothetical protein